MAKRKAAKKATHGGKREGAGRPEGDRPRKVPVSYRVPVEIKQYLDSLGAQAPATIERLIRESAAFIRFQTEPK